MALIPHIHENCDDEGACPAGLTPVEYCGIAGCGGLDFCSCEIPCESDPDDCPDGTLCVTISDGPGSVCDPLPCQSTSECGSAICCGFCGSQTCGGTCTDETFCSNSMQL
jgi:hypothetical protein